MYEELRKQMSDTGFEKLEEFKGQFRSSKFRINFFQNTPYIFQLWSFVIEEILHLTGIILTMMMNQFVIFTQQ